MALTAAVRHEQKQGNAVSILDISDFDFPHQMPFHSGVAFRKNGIADEGLAKYFKAMNVDVKRLSGFSSKFQPSCALDVDKLAISTESTLRSFLRDDFEIGKGLFARTVEAAIRRRARHALESICNFFDNEEIDEISINNGRFATQKMIASAAESRGISVSYMEQSEFPGQFYWRKYRPHDRVEFQREALDYAAANGNNSKGEASSEWQANRQKKGSLSNPFSSLWSDQGGPDQNLASKIRPREGRVVAIFTSSSDEFESLGNDWKEGSWLSQFEAFAELMANSLFSQDTFILRVHPNRKNKSLGVFIREAKKIRALQKQFPQLSVIWHNSSISSYDLIDFADVIVVQNSTLGLEASLKGKPVICLDSCWYDLVADVHRVHNSTALGQLKLRNSYSQFGATMWVEHQKYRDFQISYEFSQLHNKLFSKLTFSSIAGAAFRTDAGLNIAYEAYRALLSKLFASIPRKREIWRF